MGGLVHAHEFIAVGCRLNGETVFPLQNRASLRNAPSGKYDVVVTDPDGTEARLAGGFTIKAASTCGAGAGSAAVLFGITLGLLSFAGSGKLLRRRKRKN